MMATKKVTVVRQTIVRDPILATKATTVDDLTFEVNAMALNLGQQQSINEELLTNLTEVQGELEAMTRRVEGAEKRASEAETKAANAKEEAAKEENENHTTHIKVLQVIIDKRGADVKKLQAEVEQHTATIARLQRENKVLIEKEATARLAKKAS